jgi:hypothetical protein
LFAYLAAHLIQFFANLVGFVLLAPYFQFAHLAVHLAHLFKLLLELAHLLRIGALATLARAAFAGTTFTRRRSIGPLSVARRGSWGTPFTRRRTVTFAARRPIRQSQLVGPRPVWMKQGAGASGQLARLVVTPVGGSTFRPLNQLACLPGILIVGLGQRAPCPSSDSGRGERCPADPAIKSHVLFSVA